MDRSTLTAFHLGLIAKTISGLVCAVYFDGTTNFVPKQLAVLIMYILLLLIIQRLPDKDKSN